MVFIVQLVKKKIIRLRIPNKNGSDNMKFKEVKRVEVIGNGREYINMDCKDVEISLQDNRKTLKIFLTSNKKGTSK